MSWALIDDEGTWVSGPHDEAPVANEGQEAIEIALGWPETMIWSPELRGFLDVTPSAPLTRLAFQRLFSQAERIAVRGSADAIVIDFRELAQLAETIDLADPDVVAGVGYLETIGLIATGRSAAILARPELQ